MRWLAGAAALCAAVLGCAPTLPALRQSAWMPSDDRRSHLPDCSDLQPPAPAGSIGTPLVPGRGRALEEPRDLGIGPVRLVWTSTVGGVRLDWVAPSITEPPKLWLLRVADLGRCVVGTWSAAESGAQVIRHVFWNEGKLEIVLLGLGAPPRQRWMVLATDGTRLWSGLEDREGRPGALVAEQVELREEADRLRLVVLDGGQTAVLELTGSQFRPRP